MAKENCKMLIEIILLCVTLSVVSGSGYASMNLEPKPEKFKDEMGCYISELDRVIKYDETASSIDSSCTGYTCYPTHVMVDTCIFLEVEPPLKLVSDETKPYPGCCPTIVRPKEQNDQK